VYLTTPVKATLLAYVPSISGAGAGVMTSTLCSPLDVAKTRMQVQGAQHTHKYTGVYGSLRTIVKEEVSHHHGVHGFGKTENLTRPEQPPTPLSALSTNVVTDFCALRAITERARRGFAAGTRGSLRG
jgi:Mitochondrial carrier protein